MAGRARGLYESLHARVEELTRELAEAREQQAATSNILRVIATSPRDLPKVIREIADTALRLCQATDVTIYLAEGNLLRVMARQGLNAVAFQNRQSVPISPESPSGRAVINRQTIHLYNASAEPASEFPPVHKRRQSFAPRTVLSVPLLRQGTAIGAITILRDEVRPISDQQVALLETLADQAVIAIENLRQLQDLHDRNQELKDTLEQQTAMADVLRAIAGSPTDLPLVLETIAQSAARACQATDADVVQVEGDAFVVAARRGSNHLAALGTAVALSGGDVTGRAILEGRTIHVPDILVRPRDEYPETRARALLNGGRAWLAAPLLRDGHAIGALLIRRHAPRSFADKEIRLLQTFASQAVIAIENARLYRELEDRNHELTDALDQQTATSEVLQTISRAAFDLQAVLQTLIEHATRLCGAPRGAIYRLDGELYRLAVACNTSPELLEFEARHPQPAARGTATGRAALERCAIQIPDVLSDPDYDWPQAQEIEGYRSTLSVPMLRDGIAIGVITIWRNEVQPFSARQVELAESFADQAVIAISNAELFEQLHERNRELKDALEQETATADVLKVISRSPADLQTVLDTLVDSVARLCGTDEARIYQVEQDRLRLAARHGFATHDTRQVGDSIPIERGRIAAEAVLDHKSIHVPDIEAVADGVYPYAQARARDIGWRTLLATPLLQEDVALGTFFLGRKTAAPYTEKQIALVETFADQAVIAISNAELFRQLQNRTRELAESVEQLKAVFDVSQAVSSTLDLGALLETIAARAVELSGADRGSIFELDEGTRRLHLRTSYPFNAELSEVLRRAPLRIGEGGAGRAVATREPVQIPDATVEGAYQSSVRDILIRSGFRALLAVPLLREHQVLGALVLTRNVPGAFSPEIVELVKTFASQSAIAVQNARLFKELEEKNQALELAGRHKSQFLANMSHELRTPLNAIIGYTELILDGIYGEVPDEIRGVLDRVDASGRHLLGLINAVLDLSKIEAGQLSLALVDYSLAEVVQTVLASVEALAADKGLALELTVAPDLPLGHGDERRISQVLLNLVGNAIKFTESGEVRVTAAATDGQFVVSVADTGPGIAPADHTRVFEEFQQIDDSSTREKGGTGLGLSIARRIVELHGGRIWVESEVGKGATFTFAIPVRVAGA